MQLLHVCFVFCVVSLFCVLCSGSVFVSCCVRHPQIILIQLMGSVSSYIFLLALVLLECHAQSIVCGSGTIILTVGVQSNITCTGIRRNPTITPVLPVGLTYSNGRIQGTPVDGLPLTTYTIVDRNNYGTFTLGSRFSLSFSSLVIGNPTSISSGFNTQTVVLQHCDCPHSLRRQHGLHLLQHLARPPREPLSQHHFRRHLGHLHRARRLPRSTKSPERTPWVPSPPPSR